MHIDARKLENNSLIEGDVCIIGAGAAGVSMALDWMDTPYKVILLEGGGFDYDDDVQDLYKGKTSGQRYYPLKSCRLHFFGGTTGHWAGMCSPFDNIDFEKRDWVEYSEWPITRADLDPFYARANEKVQVGPYDYSLKYWQKELGDLTPFPLDESVIWTKVWQFTTADFNKLYKDTLVRAKNIHLYTYANVVDILAHDALSGIKEVTIKNHAGKTHTVRAKHFILACGAIQNARMLLASNSQMVNGLGNANDLVGRFFMEHLEIPSADLWLAKPFPTSLYSWEYGKTKAYGELALTEAVQRQKRILNGTASLLPLAATRHVKPRMELWKNEDPRKSMDNMIQNWGEAGGLAEQDKDPRVNNAFQLNLRMEQAPNPDSRVTIGPEKDALGVPRANLDWRLTSLDKYSIRCIFETIGQEIGKAGLGRVQLYEFLHDKYDSSWPENTNGGWHHMGTARMSDDPKKGVVDANCKVHGLDNLYVAGSACFATAGAPNPTLTVVALSLRLSDHVRERLAGS